MSLLLLFNVGQGGLADENGVCRKLEGWESDDEVEAKARVREAYREHKVVIFKHMFTLDELASDPTLLLDLKEDVREECETLGAVTNVVLYDVRTLQPQRCNHRAALFLTVWVTGRRSQKAS